MSQPVILRPLRDVHGIEIKGKTIFYGKDEFISLNKKKKYLLKIYEVD